MFILHAKDLMSAMRRLVICAVYKYIFYSIDLIPEQEYERLLLKITPGILTPPEYKVLFQHRFQSKKNLEVIPFLLIPASIKLSFGQLSRQDLAVTEICFSTRLTSSKPSIGK